MILPGTTIIFFGFELFKIDCVLSYDNTAFSISLLERSSGRVKVNLVLPLNETGYNLSVSTKYFSLYSG